MQEGAFSMKINLLLICCSVIFSCPLDGQVNLVPNHSFEYNGGNCPDGGAFSSIATAIPWEGPPFLSSDYFHECGYNGCSIPQSAYGYEFAQDSAAYAGILLYVLPNQFIYDYREYAEVQLLDTLESGKMYCVTFYVTLVDSFAYAVSNISAYFSPNGGGMNQANYFNYNPQVNHDSTIVSQKNGWTKISGTFVASGDERYLTIGNFKNDGSTNVTFVGPDTAYYWAEAYYFIDNVSVIELAPIETGVGNTICPGDTVQLGVLSIAGVSYSWNPDIGISDSSISNPLAFPQVTTTYTLTQTQCDATFTATVTITVRNDCDTPSVFFIPSVLNGNQALTISALPENSHLTIYDMRGRRVYYSENYQNDFRADSVAEATYVIELITEEGERIKQKLVIVR